MSRVRLAASVKECFTTAREIYQFRHNVGTINFGSLGPLFICIDWWPLSRIFFWWNFQQAAFWEQHSQRCWSDDLLTCCSRADLWPSHCSGRCNWQESVMGCLFEWPFPQADTRLDWKWFSCLPLMFLRSIKHLCPINPYHLVAQNCERTFLLVFKIKPKFYAAGKKIKTTMFDD